MPPRWVSLSFLADRCATMEQLKHIHAQMIVTARIHDSFAASRLLCFSALSEPSDLGYATRIFENVRNPNTFMWNTLIRAHANGNNPTRALLLYVKMTRLGVFPNFHTYPFVLKACSKLKCLESSRQAHTHVFKHGFELDSHVVNGLVRSYSVSGDLDSARSVFDVIPHADLNVWTSMICGYAQNSRFNDVLILFDRMVKDRHEPNGATLASVLSACAHLGSLELGVNIHAFMKDRGIEVGVILGTALVHMYAMNGEISAAKNLFNSMKQRNLATWNSMICGLASHGHAQEALCLFSELESEKIEPNDVTFVGVLSACRHAGLIETGREMFDLMRLRYGIEPKIEHYGCMVDLLGRSGEILEAEELIREMPIEADVVILGALLSACKSHGNVEVAERVAEKMMGLDPNNHGVYVVMSNVYAEAERWKEMERLRKRMKSESLVKAPGWSFLGSDKSRLREV
ncbi:PREDICTED: pentatricopeptide repeat-containing protein At5g06540 isoform X2 [Tarenaya hassleriana]|uniref:pentatricopeptide repeat-containing protein At5g06540 isoform X2 n=1 Tax=Tarenaya hassleriana TaxID=28532 RepID=UPI0008FD22C7|nr:PREDICTED: pentatricopeptide repeat-containing protein At5g06540 isoform X2 [Tarenaya hassleriana]